MATIQTEAEESEIERKTEQNPTDFLKTYFDFGFFLMLHPFRLYAKETWGQNDNKFQTFYARPHQILCGFTQFLALVRLGSSLRKVPVENILEDSSIYFMLIHSIESLLYHATVFFMFWFKRDILSSAINQIQSHAFTFLPKSSQAYKMLISPKVITIVLCGFYSIKAITDVVVGYTYIHIKHWSPIELFSAYAEEGRFVLFISPNFSTAAERALQFNEYDVTFFNLLIVLIMGAMQFYREITVHFSDLGLLLFALTLLWHANAFKHNVRISINENEEFRGEILEQYEALKRISRLLNRAFAPVVLIFLFEAIPYYSAHLGDFLIVTDWYNRVRFLFFMIQFVIILVISAEVAHKMNVLQEWIGSGRNYEKIQHSHLTFLLHELSTHPIGLSINGIATISYTQLATMLSIIVTYFIIMLQFQSGRMCGVDSSNHTRGRNESSIGFTVPFIIM